MHAIILPGNSKQYNEQWLADAAKNLANIFESVIPHTYKHWQIGTGEELADIKFEAAEVAKKFSKIDGEVVILAKSIGVPTALHAVVENGIHPTRCVFVGSAFEDANEELVGLATKFTIPTLFIEQTDDMFFPYAKLAEFLTANWKSKYKLIEIPGSNHAYDNFPELKQMIRDFLQE